VKIKTITIMIWEQGTIIPKIKNIKNTTAIIEEILGGEISIIANETPIKTTMVLGGPKGKKGTLVIVKNTTSKLGGLTKDDQKQAMIWFLRNPRKGPV